MSAHFFFFRFQAATTNDDEEGSGAENDEEDDLEVRRNEFFLEKKTVRFASFQEKDDEQDQIYEKLLNTICKFFYFVMFVSLSLSVSHEGEKKLYSESISIWSLLSKESK